MDNVSPNSKSPMPNLQKFEQIADVPLILQAELDRHTISLGNLLALNVGDVLALPKPAGENVTVYAGDTLIGWAEVLVVDGVTAVRIADLCELQTEHSNISGNS